MAIDNLAQIGESWTGMAGVLGSIPTRYEIYFLLSYKAFNANIAILVHFEKKLYYVSFGVTYHYEVEMVIYPCTAHDWCRMHVLQECSLKQF